MTMNLKMWLRSMPFGLVCDETEEQKAAAAAAAAVNAEQEVDDLPESAKGKTQFTQEEFNKALAEDRKKHKARFEKQKAETDKQIKNLETLQKSKNLTEKEKSDLHNQIEQLRNSQLTEKELAAKEKDRLESGYKATVQGLTTERDTWQNRFVKSTINTVIVSEAAKAEAFDADSLIALLGPNTRLAEETDQETGKGLDIFTPRVKFADADKDGKAITLDLTVEQAIKRMKELPKYGYLFKSTAAGGLGAAAGTGKGGDAADVAKMTHEQYLKHRKTVGLGPRTRTTK